MSTTVEKISKILKLQDEVALLVLQSQEECNHDYVVRGSWDTDDGYSKRECTQYTNHVCTLCSHSFVKEITFNT